MDNMAILESLDRGSVAIVAVGPDGTVGYCNAASRHLFGDLASVSLASPPVCEDPRSPLATLVDAWEACRADAGACAEEPRLVRARRDGLSAFLWTQSLPLGGGRSAGRLFLFTDLSAFLSGSEPVRRLVSQLAHDLRSPLTSISGAAELLLSGRVGDLQGVQEKLVRIVEDGAGRMSHIIRNAAEEGRGREQEEGGTAA